MDSVNHRPLTHEVVAQLRACGHFLYYRMGGRVGRRRILTFLSEYPNILQKELQDILQIQSGSLSEVIIKLESDGLVNKGRSEMDGRQFTLNLTQKGQEEAKRIKEEYDEQVREMMSCFSEEELEQLHQMLKIMFAHWNATDLCLEKKNIEKKENEQCSSHKSS